MATGIRPNADPTVANWYNPDFEPQECYPAMEFRLVYDGPLKCASKDKPRVPEKHAIRKQIHKQLSLLYDNHPSLRSMRHYVYTEGDMAHKVVFEGTGYLPEAGKTMTQAIARNYVRANGFEFVPLVNKAYSLICGLDIVFLRRENPGDLLVQGGDIDNRFPANLW